MQILDPVSPSSPITRSTAGPPAPALAPEDVPGANTLWTVEEGDTLTPDTPVTLGWDNGTGLIFRRTIAVDDNYMFTVTQSVENTGAAPASLAPYGIIARRGEPADRRSSSSCTRASWPMTDGALRNRVHGHARLRGRSRRRRAMPRSSR